MGDGFGVGVGEKLCRTRAPRGVRVSIGTAMPILRANRSRIIANVRRNIDIILLSNR
jgi:hypothetical protein